MPLQIRSAHAGDFPAIYDLLEASFPEAPPSAFIAQTEQDSTFRYRHGHVGVDNRRIVAYVRIFARSMLVRGVPIPSGGIGSVATAGNARHSGYATLLLRDAIAQMRREGMRLSFLFTGIPSFYERLGFQIVRQRYFEARRNDAAALPKASCQIAPLTRSELPQLLALYGHAIEGTTGAIVRTNRSWRDAATALDENASFVAKRGDRRCVAYIRSRCREYGHQILEAECLPGEEPFVGELLRHLASEACACGKDFVATVPHTSVLAAVLRSLPSCAETADVRYPMMLLPLDDTVDRACLDDEMYFWNADRI